MSSINLLKFFLPNAPSPWDVPRPVHFNPWKHHAGFLRKGIREAAAGGEPALSKLAGELVVVGTELMDLYTGTLTPAEISRGVLDRLGELGTAAPEAFAAWVRDNGGYGLVTLTYDGSRWVLRRSDEPGRYVHVHPARYSPRTRRVRANVLKTAVMALAHAGVHGGDPLDRSVVNAVRRDYLGLAPMGKEISGEQGLGVVIETLRLS